MNNIENPIEPKQPPTSDFLKELHFEFVNNYLDNDNTDSAFHEALETHIFENGLIHHWLRKLYTAERDNVELDMRDTLSDFARTYIESNL